MSKDELDQAYKRGISEGIDRNKKEVRGLLEKYKVEPSTYYDSNKVKRYTVKLPANVSVLFVMGEIFDLCKDLKPPEDK